MTVPSIAPSELMAAVAARRAQFSTSAPNASSPIQDALKRALGDIEARIVILTRRCAPRSELPRSLARLQFASVPILAVYNYATKAQREIALEQAQVCTSLVAVLRLAIGSYDD